MNFNYNLIFLDVNLGDTKINGIQLGRELRQINHDIQLIFTTAYREFAFEAFELEAVDYLLKPFNETKVLHAISKVRKSLNNSKEFIIQIGSYFINTKDIIFVEKIQRKLKFITKENSIDTYDTLSNIENKLPNYFYKSHQSFLVNIHNIKQITSDSPWSYLIKFHGTDQTAILSRQKYKELTNLISNLSP
jgi:DNA-binding LytR/AlgR family response regulator